MGYGNQNKTVMAYHRILQEHRSYDRRITHQAQRTTCSVKHVILAVRADTIATRALDDVTKTRMQTSGVHGTRGKTVFT